jgi:hypothetical protein
MNKTLTTLVAVAATSFAATAGPVWLASTTYAGETFSLYESPGTSWAYDEAFAASLAPGTHLAVLDDAAKTAAVYGALHGIGFFSGGGQANSAYIGGQPNIPGSDVNPFDWHWVTGAPWNAFSSGNWAPNEPNGDSGGLSINRYGNSTWNDDYYVGGFITQTPDSGTSLVLMGAGLAVVGAFGRKLRK